MVNSLPTKWWLPDKQQPAFGGKKNNQIACRWHPMLIMSTSGMRTERTDYLFNLTPHWTFSIAAPVVDNSERSRGSLSKHWHRSMCTGTLRVNALLFLLVNWASQKQDLRLWQDDFKCIYVEANLSAFNWTYLQASQLLKKTMSQNVRDKAIKQYHCQNGFTRVMC